MNEVQKHREQLLCSWAHRCHRQQLAMMRKLLGSNRRSGRKPRRRWLKRLLSNRLGGRG